MDIIKLKTMLENNDFLIFHKTLQREVIEAHDSDIHRRITSTIVDSVQEMVLPETLESDLIVYRREHDVQELLAEDTCSCCGKGINTLIPCPGCRVKICQDCLGIHQCEPDGHPSCEKITED